MRKSLFILISLFITQLTFSQTKEIKEDKYKFVATFDMRNSVIIGHSVKFNGVKLGLGNSKHRFGVGFYGLRKPVHTFDNKVDFIDATDTNRYQFGFLSLYYEKILFRVKRLEFSAPVHLNFGALKREYLSTKKRCKQFLDKDVSSMTLSVKSQFKIVRWGGLDAGIGYNFILSGDKRTRKALNFPFYSFGVKIFLGEIWKIMTKKEYRKLKWEK